LYSIPVQVRENNMAIEITYTQARDRLAKILDEVTKDREVVIIRRRGNEDAALIAASELTSLLETAYLLRSPVNAQRLLAALGRALQNQGQALSPSQLRREVGLLVDEEQKTEIS
jgi:antitoxin YefM